MAGGCKAAIGCVDARVPVRASYVSLYKWPESDAEFVRSVAMGRRQRQHAPRGWRRRWWREPAGGGQLLVPPDVPPQLHLLDEEGDRARAHHGVPRPRPGARRRLPQLPPAPGRRRRVRRRKLVRQLEWRWRSVLREGSRRAPRDFRRQQREEEASEEEEGVRRGEEAAGGLVRRGARHLPPPARLHHHRRRRGR
uniref:Uncharacterized protein n=1 Tax=Aegilops tauschii subsp. strangulata TaxID=200361 RepID=A0A452XQX5_AEGTS